MEKEKTSIREGKRENRKKEEYKEEDERSVGGRNKQQEYE